MVIPHHFFFLKFIPIKKLKTLVKMMFRLIKSIASQFSGRHLSISYKINLLSCLAKASVSRSLKRRKDSNVWCLFKLSWRKKKNMRKIWYEKGLKMVFCLRKLRRKQKTTTKQSFPNMLAKWISGTLSYLVKYQKSPLVLCEWLDRGQIDRWED